MGREDGRRVAAAGPDNINGYDPVSKLYVFEIPDEVTFAGTQQDTFESNNFARWTATAGQFAVATNGASRVLRQSSLAGDAGAYLTAACGSFARSPSTIETFAIPGPL